MDPKQCSKTGGAHLATFAPKCYSKQFKEFEELQDFKKPAVSTTRTLKADFVFRVAGSPVL